MKNAVWMLSAILILVGSTAQAEQNLPIKSGRWSQGSCSSRSSADTRHFRGGKTWTSNDSCTISIMSVNGSTFKTRLKCSYNGGGGATDDLTVAVHSPTSLTWTVSGFPSGDYTYCGGR